MTKLSEENKNLLENWENTPIHIDNKMCWDSDCCSLGRFTIGKILHAKDLEAEQKVEEALEKYNKIAYDKGVLTGGEHRERLLDMAVRKERERCLKILFEKWSSHNNPTNFSEIKNKILNPEPPKD